MQSDVLGDVSAEALEAELKRRKEGRYPQDLKSVVDRAAEVGAYQGFTPRQVLEDAAKSIRAKRR